MTAGALLAVLHLPLQPATSAAAPDAVPAGAARAEVIAGPPITETGYLTTADGVRLRYTVIRPADGGEHPVLLQYDGYNAGSNPTRVNTEFAATMLEQGYALMGLSARGTGCSGGDFDLFSPEWGTDGAMAVEWAHEQPWSTGKVGMFSFSFGGFMQLLTAERRPRGLAAIAPGMVVSDMYRDVGYPGGIVNVGFPPAWEAALHLAWAQAAQQAESGSDPECLANIARHQVLNIPAGVIATGLAHPFQDRFYRRRSPERLLGQINVPTLGQMAWQDEQTGPRGGLAFDQLNPRTTWTVGTNGMHGMYASSPRSRALLRNFFDHYLKGAKNGWQQTPHVQLWQEATIDDYNPSWVRASNTRPFPSKLVRLQLQPSGRLTRGTEPSRGAPTSYLTPVTSPGVVSEQIAVDQSTVYGLTWQVTPVNPLGSAAFTTERLERDLVLAGTGSLDLWLKTTSVDADVQVTVTEVRPDGQEMYVQRGWLRLSQRALDASRSTATLPRHPFTRGASKPTPLGRPFRARIEIQPFSHAFRAGSRLRIWLDSPSATGLWNFTPLSLSGLIGAPTSLTVLHDRQHPSRLVVGQIAGNAPNARPACGSLASQPCRRDPLS